MDNRTLLIKSIVLLYKESLLEINADPSIEAVRKIIECVKLTESTELVDRERDALVSLKNYVLEMCDNGVTYKYSKSTLLSALKLACDYDTDSYETLLENIEPVEEADELKTSINNLKDNLTYHDKEQKIKEIINKAASDIKFNRDKIPNLQNYITDVITQLEPHQKLNGDQDPAIIESINFSDVDGVAKIYDKVKSEADGSLILKTGFQALNRAFQKGIRLGNLFLCNALQHKYKTGLNLTLFKQVCLYNDAELFKQGTDRKPLIIRISFEDPLQHNLQFLYQNLKANEKVDYDINKTTVEEMAKYVTDKLQATGFSVQMLSINPTGFSYRQLLNLFLKYEAQGYIIVAAFIDYLGKLPTTGCTQGPSGSDIEDMFSRIASFGKTKNIAIITPGQLNSAAKALIRDGRNENEFVKEVAGKGYTEKCSSLDRVIDLELAIHIVKHNGKSLLTCMWGKHRLPTIPKEKDKYFILPFNEYGIMDDVNGPDSSMIKVGGGTIGSGEEIPYWEIG